MPTAAAIMKTRHLLPLAVLTGALLFSVTPAAQMHAESVAEKPAAAASRARTETVQQTLAQIRKEVEERGGWTGWAEKLRPYREALQELRKTPWPWPAKNNTRFEGKEVDLAVLETLEGREQSPLEAIVHLDRQLKRRGIDLIFVPIPDKLGTYPEYLSDTAPPELGVEIQVTRLMEQLLERDVEVVDLYTPFREFRQRHKDEVPLYYVRDSHWRNTAVRIAGEKIAERLKRYAFVQTALEKGSPYTTTAFRREDGEKADDVLLVIDPATGEPLQESPDSPVVLTGDSFSMYNMKTKGHLPAHVSLHAGIPLAFIVREGLWGDMPVDLAKMAAKGFLQEKKVVIWTLAARSLVAGKWPKVDLDSAALAQPAGEVVARGTVAEVSSGPQRDAPYKDYISKWHVRDLVNEKGEGIGPGDGVVHILTMQNNTVLPAAAVEQGKSVRLRLKDWAAMEKERGATNTGILPTTELELQRPHYWGELVE